MIFEKFKDNPIFGSEETGTLFDVFVTTGRDGRLRMDLSTRRNNSLSVSFSDDGINWSAPQTTLPPDESSGWEDAVNRNCVLKIGDTYKMWFTGQAHGNSYIGLAESADGINFKKSPLNPILKNNPENEYEQERIGGCQVIPHKELGYLVFYIGYRDIHTACICCAYSRDGVTDFHRYRFNPLVSPSRGEWDNDSCYKPSALYDAEKNLWRIWYNGRGEAKEYIGLAQMKGDFKESDFMR